MLWLLETTTQKCRPRSWLYRNWYFPQIWWREVISQPVVLIIKVFWQLFLKMLVAVIKGAILASWLKKMKEYESKNETTGNRREKS